MGDAGSMFVGMSIAWLLIDLSQGEDRSFAPVTALWLFAMPLIEMVTAVLRRLTSGKSPFKPDLGHTHHILTRLGIREKYTLLLMLLVSLLMVIIGILGELYGVTEWVMFVGFLLVFVKRAHVQFAWQSQQKVTCHDMLQVNLTHICMIHWRQ